jgi:hypothetical protein
VLPTGTQPQLVKGPGPNPAHTSPSGHTPLQAGAVSPQGELGEMHTQPENVGVQTPSPRHVPPHAGNSLEAHVGVTPFRLSSEQLDNAVKAARDATNAPATSLRIVEVVKRAQFRSVPVVMRMPTVPCGTASGSPASFATSLMVFPCLSTAIRAGEIPAGAWRLRNL